MKHNSYFEGKVQSLGLETADGYATVGVITSGKYTFHAESEEHVLLVAGKVRVQLPNEDWKTVETGEKYVVPRQSSFEVAADNDAAYICFYKQVLV